MIAGWRKEADLRELTLTKSVKQHEVTSAQLALAETEKAELQAQLTERDEEIAALKRRSSDLEMELGALVELHSQRLLEIN